MLAVLALEYDGTIARGDTLDPPVGGDAQRALGGA
jgi:hypothetical protein